MNFAEVKFWLALGIGLVIVWLIRIIPVKASRKNSDKYLLFALGIGLLFFVGWVTATVFLYVALVTYFGTKMLLKKKRFRSASAGLLAFFQLAPLVWFKYSFFISNGIFGIYHTSLMTLAIPVGISFYTFQCMSFSWDVIKQNHSQQNQFPKLIDFLNFAGFFPQIVAGPIERKKDLLPQIQNFKFSFDKESIDKGTTWVIIGLFFKLCLADNLAIYFRPGELAQSAWAVWFQNVIFGFRIYFDFAGYSLIALGVGQWLGIGLTLNFLSPYTQKSITGFWRTWHVTLSQWFRDYIYFRTGGNKWTKGVVPMLVVFLVSGAWHGAGWNFIMWGLFHGVMVLTHRFFAQKISWPPFLGWMITTLGVFFAWLFFYQTDLEILLQNLRVLLNPTAYSPALLKNFILSFGAGDVVVIFGLLLLVVFLVLTEFLGRTYQSDPYGYLSKYPVLFLLIGMTIILAPASRNSFIYFAF